MTRVVAWLRARLDRIADRRDRIADAVADRWYGFTEGIAGWWYRRLDRMTDRRERFIDAAVLRWDAVTSRIRGRRPEGDRSFLKRMDDQWALIIGSFAITRNTVTSRFRQRVQRTDWPRTGSSQRPITDWVVVFALAGVISLAAMAAISALRDAVSERSGRPRASPSDPEATPERTEGAGAAPPEESPGSDVDTPLDAFRVYRDALTGFRFVYPSDWEVLASAGITRLVDAGRDITISFRTARSGSIEALSERLVQSLAGRYETVDVVAREEGETPRGEPSLVLGVDATEVDGSTTSFMIVAIEGPVRNRAITVRFAPHTDPLEMSPLITRIVGSFRLSADATAA